MFKCHFLILAGIFSFYLTNSLSAQSLDTLTHDHFKIKHVAPVFADFSTDLGSKKGESELNVNFGYQNFSENYHELLSQLELEFALFDDIGIEIRLPYSVYLNNQLATEERPENKMEFVQWSLQYTFFKSIQRGISIATGLTNTFEIESPESQLASNRVPEVKAILYYPFLIFAKNINDKYFFTFAGGPQFSQEFEENQVDFGANFNSAFHYGFSENDHYIGLELNQQLRDGELESFVRPQVSFELSDKFSLGIAIGVPVGQNDVNWNGFLRLNYKL